MLNIQYIQGLARFLDANPCIDYDMRIKILYPLLDEIYTPGETLELELECGLKLSYLYRSNIAKEILLRAIDIPNHAWEPMTTECVRLAIRWKSGSVLVGGAYFGDHSLIAAHELKGKDKDDIVLCIEPNDEQRTLLICNAKANNLQERLKAIRGILWENSGRHFELEATDSHAAVKPSNDNGIKSSTINSLTSASGCEELALILLDIEGSEEAALRGATEWLEKPSKEAPIIIVEVHRNYVDWSEGLDRTSIVSFLHRHGYHIYALRDCQSNQDLGILKPEIIPLDSVYLEGPPHGFNLICSKDPAFFSNSRFRVVTNVSPKYLRHRNPKLHAPIK